MNNDFTEYIAGQQQELLRKRNAWDKALAVVGCDANHYRKDAYGWWIHWAAYGTTGLFGWEIDHILPKAHFPGLNGSGNLRALHWRNNRAMSDKVDGQAFINALYPGL